MNDRELLELTYKASGHADKEILLLAVKAAGIEHYVIDNEYKFEIRTGTPADGYYKHEDDSQYWNPLINDGDALRLAVKLRGLKPVAWLWRLENGDVDFAYNFEFKPPAKPKTAPLYALGDEK